jgi:thiamine biosynthesis lipoprotein
MIYRIDFKAMGCRMLAMVDAIPNLLQDSSAPEVTETLSQTPNWFEEWEQALSRFRSESELSSLNRAAGMPMQVSETLWEVLQAARSAEINSQGLVTATVLDALIGAGYDRSFDLMPAERVSAPTSGWHHSSSLNEIDADPLTHTIVLPVDMQLDFGGVAKGWAAQQAARKLSVFGPALVSAGGDISVSGAQRNGELWPVTIDNPFQPGEFLGTLMLGAGGVATSGTDYRRWKQGGRWNHHIIDPRSGQPAQTDVVTATVIAPNALQAEMAAKAVVILGGDRGLDWIEKRPGFSAMLVLETGDILYSTHMEHFFWRSQ